MRADQALYLAHLSLPSLLAGGAVTVLALLLWRPLARWLGWAPRATLVSLLLLAAVVALTMGPGGSTSDAGIRACVRRAPRLVDATIARPQPPFETGLNVLLLLPLGVAVVLAARRVVPALAVVLLLPAAIELTQTAIPGRVCSGVDYATNASGGMLGVLLGAALLVVLPGVGLRRAGRRARGRTGTTP